MAQAAFPWRSLGHHLEYFRPLFLKLEYWHTFLTVPWTSQYNFDKVFILKPKFASAVFQLSILSNTVPTLNIILKEKQEFFRPKGNVSGLTGVAYWVFSITSFMTRKAFNFSKVLFS